VAGWLQSLIAAVVGGLLVAGCNYLVFRLQDSAQGNRELRAALADFMAVLDQIGGELERVPQQPTAAQRAVNDALSKVPNLESSIRELSQRIWAPHLRPLMERFYVTGARVTLIATPPVLDSVVALTELLGEAESRDEEWPSRWTKARGQLLAESRSALGASAL
jgi:outer membrane murein-binding lipoprotein Lpp